MSVARDQVSSVGRALEEEQIYSTDHPTYRSFADQVEFSLSRIAEREALRRASAHTLVCTTALDSSDQDDLSRVYPEFELRVIPLGARVHSLWYAHRLCANDWLVHHVDIYASKIVHYGGNLLSKLISGCGNHHIEYDASDEVSVNEAHNAVVDVYRIYGDMVKFQADNGIMLRKSDYDEYIRKRAYQTCTRAHNCTKKADTVCVDMSLKLLSVEQVAAAMKAHDAELAVGFFIYEPSMLVQDSGMLTRDGVGFEKTESKILFKYPQGRSGAASYDKATWARWLSSHVFRVGSEAGEHWYQLELLKNRGPFMFYRMVAVSKPTTSVTLTHALDLSTSEEKMLVKSWRLRDGLFSDAGDKKSWEPHLFLVPMRVVERTMQFAMQLTPGQFSRFAIKKQIRVVNNRWVVSGVMVSTSPALEPRLIEDLTTAIFVKAFTDRYNSSQLSTEMMACLNKLAAANGISVASRLAYIASAAATWAGENTVGRVTSAVRKAVGSFEQWLSNGLTDAGVEMAPAPTYVLMRTYAAGWHAVFRSRGEVFYDQSLPYGGDFAVEAEGMGGSLAYAVRKYASVGGGAVTGFKEEVQRAIRVVTDLTDTRISENSDAADLFVDAVETLHPLDQAPANRHVMEFQISERQAEEIVGEFKAIPDPDPVHSLNQLYAESFPKVAATALEFDTFSLSLDPQDRNLAVPYLRMPIHFGAPPVPKLAYRSKLNALNVPKRQNTNAELLTAVNARNMSAPQISIPQPDTKIREIWDNFLDTMCVRGEDGNMSAREKLALYQSDPVALEEGALKDWSAKARPEVLERVVRELNFSAKALDERDVGTYEVMLKSDVKPSLSNKPLKEVTAPQVIVYHEKTLSALYSSMFRVLVRRFQSLLKDNIHVNLLKNAQDMAQMITDHHDFTRKWKYLENDFSKFDKSQSQFAFDLEYYVFQQLGLNQDMLDKWYVGHVECSLRAIATGLSLHVLYQRKSGDATTAFGNAILNVLSVSYAYKGTDIKWALFMGDDSLVCAGEVVGDATAVTELAEVFNLSAKYYITQAPYFASNFVVLDDARQQARMLPDPVKRIERLSMHVNGDEPQWHERYVSLNDSLSGYRDPSSAAQLAVLVPQRYAVSEGFVRGAAAALGTIVRQYTSFRGLWEDSPEIIQA